MRHVPILRSGRPYRSLDLVRIPDVRTGEPVAEVSQANRGLIARDLSDPARLASAVRERSVSELLSIGRKAAVLFSRETLSVDGDDSQSPQDYLESLSATTGMPLSLCRANMEKIRTVLDRMPAVLAGWTRGLDTALLDSGWGVQDGRRLSYRPEADLLGAVLPNNSPGVHALWIPALALKYPLVLRPGRLEPWTPLRVARALMAAGAPPEAFGFYPGDHGGAVEVLLRCGRSMLFGDAATLRPWTDDPRVQLHGPGWSKVVLDEDAASRWPDHLEMMTASIADNGGRSCLNASGVWTAASGLEIAEGLARRLVSLEARALDDPGAGLAAFPDPRQAERLSSHIDALLQVPGAEDVSARVRGSGRVSKAGGCTFLLPTIIRCHADHPLARCEYLFPFAAVVEVPEAELARRLGPTLVATVLAREGPARAALAACPDIDRLNMGPIPTSRVEWDQPHEGNLFDHLYRRRAVQVHDAA
ncbi:MAG TPA: aldehyde dehydrogenase family protein [Candidatus Polarisedimenticolia bacterium]|nr:aldehyde dehydrogenase family protein [Candidatus Polarisedimenticolia bacterium]